MHSYDTLQEALKDLNSRGYTEDFNLSHNYIHCENLNLQIHPEDFEIKEVYRFEGDSNPDDSAVVYAIESIEGVKGVLVDAYGAYSEAISPSMASKLRVGIND